MRTFVHHVSVSVVPIPEITGTWGRRTAASDRGGSTKVGKVKALMDGIVPLIVIRTGVVHHPCVWRTSLMTGGVRIGSCAAEGMEEIDLLDIMQIR